MTDRIIVVTDKKEVNISELERRRDHYLAMADEIEFLAMPSGAAAQIAQLNLGLDLQQIEQLMIEKNAELELQKADMLDQANLIQEEINSYD